jgi:uncharacterized protein (TIGR03437 family)
VLGSRGIGNPGMGESPDSYWNFQQPMVCLDDQSWTTGYVFGSNFGALENTTVTVGGLRAEVLAASSNRIRALFPATLQVGHSKLVVTVDGAVSEAVYVIVGAHAEEPALLAKGSVSPGRTVQSYPPALSETPMAPQSLPFPSTTDPTTGSGIVYTCDLTITEVSATACDTLNTTIAALYSRAFTNANASIYVTLGSVELGQSNFGYNFFDYSSFRNALTAAASGPNDNTAIANSLPEVNPFGDDSVDVVNPLQRALGLSSAPCLAAAGCYDGTITISNTEPLYFRTGVISSDQYDFFTVVEHETDEILGTAALCCGSTGIVFPADYFRYHSDGTRSFAYGSNDACSSSGSTNACFSIDGMHMLQQYNNLNNGQDTGDWVYDCAHPLLQDYANCSGTAGVDISPGAEILVLNVVGYTLVPPSPLAYYSRTPCRVADTRSFGDKTGAFGPPFITGGPHAISQYRQALAVFLQTHRLTRSTLQLFRIPLWGT